MVFIISDVDTKKYSFEEALDRTGFGIYNISMLVSCCLMILAMYLDIFGFSVVLPAVACDMGLNTTQQGLLSAVPLIGVMASSYGWGLSADTIGRQKTLLIAMPIGFLLNLAASMAGSYTSLAVLKLFSSSFTSSANAAAFVLMAESVPARHRNRFMFHMVGTTMAVQFIICVVALGVFKFSFHTELTWLNMEYRPWRLLLQIISLPGGIGVLILLALCESPKFFLCKGKDEEALEVLEAIFGCNKGHKEKSYSVANVYLEEPAQDRTNISFIKKMWNQTAPLFKPPLLKNSVVLYYLLLCAFMTSTGFTMWVPTITNAYFTGEDSAGKTFCEVASRIAITESETSADCDSIIQTSTLYAVMCYSGVATILTILLSFLVGPLGKKLTTLLVFAIATLSGVLLLFVTLPMLSIALFFIFLHVAQILGNVNTYLVELNPTYLRGMATCLSVVVARGFGFFSVQLIASLMADHCTYMVTGYIVLIASGLIIALFLPKESNTMKIRIKGQVDNINKDNTMTAQRYRN